MSSGNVHHINIDGKEYLSRHCPCFRQNTEEVKTLIEEEQPDSSRACQSVINQLQTKIDGKYGYI